MPFRASERLKFRTIEFQFGKTGQKLRGLEEETLVTSSNPVSQVLW